MPDPNPFILENSSGYRFADNLAALMRSGRAGIERLFDRHPVTAAAVPAGIGAGAGYGIGKAVDWYRMRNGGALPRNLALALGLGGAALGGYASTARRKNATVKCGAMPFGMDFGGVRDSTHAITMRIRQDPELSHSQKQTLLSALTNLSPDAVQRLKQVVAGLSGAALFATIMRLAGSGGRGMMGGAVAGGLAGLALAGGPQRTSQGLRSQPSRIF